jgi:hypothetical protein
VRDAIKLVCGDPGHDGGAGCFDRLRGNGSCCANGRYFLGGVNIIALVVSWSLFANVFWSCDGRVNGSLRCERAGNQDSRGIFWHAHSLNGRADGRDKEVVV